MRESLSNHTDEEQAQHIYDKLKTNQFQNETEFVKELNEEEEHYLNSILEQEIEYAKQAQDERRVKELNEVYERLLP